MSNTFDTKRFGHYVSYTLQSNAKSYALAIGGLLAALLFTVLYPLVVGTHDTAIYAGEYSWMSGDDPMWNTMENDFMLGIFVFCSLMAALTFNNMAKKTDRISSLMMPASQFEKFLTRWLIYVPLSMLVFYLCFVFVDVVRCSAYSVKYPDTDLIKSFLSSDFFKERCCVGSIEISWVILLQGLMVLGSSIWPKKTFLKTILALGVLGVIYTIWGLWLANKLFEPNMYYGNDMDGDTVADMLRYANYAYCLILSVIAYYRIKEMEIVQRW